MKSLNCVAVLPARMGSSRFPGKPMAKILGVPMIEHVYRRVKMAKSLSEVYVATCDAEIYEHILAIGGKAVYTSDKHERCSDRCAEAMLKIESENSAAVDILVMVQGDEPMVHPEMIDEALAPMLENAEIYITNLLGTIETVEEFEDPNEVKVVVDRRNRALYFSREPIPSRKKGSLSVPMLKQVCIIPFRRDFLLEYNSMRPTPLEVIESVDMMRILENDLQVLMVPTSHKTKAVDTIEDLHRVEKEMLVDPLCSNYLTHDL